MTGASSARPLAEGNAHQALPDEADFAKYLRRRGISEHYALEILQQVRRINRDCGGIPTDLERFTEEILLPRGFSRGMRCRLRAAARRYREYRKLRFGENFRDE